MYEIFLIIIQSYEGFIKIRTVYHIYYPDNHFIMIIV